MAFTMHKAAVEGFRTGGGSQELANLPWLGHGLAGAWPGKGPGLARGLAWLGPGPGWGLAWLGWAWLEPGLAGAWPPRGLGPDNTFKMVPSRGALPLALPVGLSRNPPFCRTSLCNSNHFRRGRPRGGYHFLKTIYLEKVHPAKCSARKRIFHPIHQHLPQQIAHPPMDVPLRHQPQPTTILLLIIII